MTNLLRPFEICRAREGQGFSEIEKDAWREDSRIGELGREGARL